jgi:hypothetical protein
MTQRSPKMKPAISGARYARGLIAAVVNSMVATFAQEAPSDGGKKGAGGKKGGRDSKGLVKPTMADTYKINVYADNWFVLYINGRLVAVDSIEFTPHNVISVERDEDPDSNDELGSLS